jgi:invasion protein IalB
MKAKDWLVQLDQNSNVEDFFKAYAKETADLIADRTKKSGVIQRSDNKKIDTKPAVIDGVLREQKQKWHAICARNSSVTISDFEHKVVNTHLSDIALSQRKWTENKAKQEKENKVVAPVGGDGRTLVANINK